MTQHMSMQDSEDDVQALKNLRNFVGLFVVFAGVLALGVAIFAP